MSTLTLDRAFAPLTTQRPGRRPVRRTARPVQGELRLTRRGRVVVLVTAVLVAFVVGVVLAAGSVATGHAGTPEATRVIVVQPGQTLWKIAAKYDDGGSISDSIAHLQDLNALGDSVDLQVGQHLRVPAAR